MSARVLIPSTTLSNELKDSKAVSVNYNYNYNCLNDPHSVYNEDEDEDYILEESAGNSSDDSTDEISDEYTDISDNEIGHNKIGNDNAETDDSNDNSDITSFSLNSSSSTLTISNNLSSDEDGYKDTYNNSYKASTPRSTGSTGSTDSTNTKKLNIKNASTSKITISIENNLSFLNQNVNNFIKKHEIPRKVLHISIGFITLYLYGKGYEISDINPILITGFLILLSIDVVRLNFPRVNQLYIRYFGLLMRQKEVNSVNGVIYYLLGLIIPFSLFSKDISMLSVLLLSWSDTAASTFGRLYGHLTPRLTPNKSLAGSIAAFFTGVFSCIILYAYFLPKNPTSNHLLLRTSSSIMYSADKSRLSLPLFSLLCGLIAAISEAIQIFNLDDNFTIPVLSSCFLYAVLRVASK
ncbi:diacylglycerol kinase ASCRUDRAFT_78327 [Ascoidea rubescens DSM 1968]|uniref:Phosphatidate cytidylyltransferase n=1 Tax=Ascoidea rubescens DSM 1968 TaxID=1344418 RepID=A0A1D2V8B9_9ASCO|nr:hypothetical protein ASCRUDRAFT_78327 [Ascoidea rubescens DSM 1968]ODV57870.1 hypothetical protein ASCRUDRAFT_78327 [Ascoidea rubescens DSM 1968]